MADLKNLYKRIIVAVIGIALLTAATYIGFLPFLFFIICIAVVGVLEFYSIIKQIGMHPHRLLGSIVTIILILLFFMFGGKFGFSKEQQSVFLSLLLTLIIIFPFIRVLFKKSIERSIFDIAATIFGVLYVGWLLGHFILLRSISPGGKQYVFFVLITVWTIDTTAYFMGIKFGKHKIVPRISPKKSWEGSIAGFFGAIAAAVISKFVFLSILSLKQALILGALIGIVAQISDFSESLIKRNANVKDSSNLLPGHGGILDRFDSFMFVVPMVYYYLILVK